MQDTHKQVEAVLFAVGKEITTKRIAALCSLSIEETQSILKELQHEYSQRDHSLQIVEKEDGFKLTVRDQFVPLVSSIVSSTELERPLMETLAVIAWKYPIVQSEIIKLRSSAAYEHMKLLEEQGFISKERFGRTYKVKLTKKFFTYFDLPSEEAKQAFLKTIPPDVLEEAQDTQKEADEVERLIELEQKEDAAKSEIGDAMKQVQGETQPAQKETFQLVQENSDDDDDFEQDDEQEDQEDNSSNKDRDNDSKNPEKPQEPSESGNEQKPSSHEN